MHEARVSYTVRYKGANMRIVSLSVDGIFQAAQRGLFDWITHQDADIICLQDLCAMEKDLDDAIFHPEGYFTYYFDSGANRNGIAIYTRNQPKALIYGLGFSSGVDMDGRYLQVDFEKISVGSLLAPSVAADKESQETKMKFFDDFQAHLHKITRKRRDFIFCGNWAIAHKQDDVQNWKANQTLSGYLPQEQQWMNQLFSELGYVDAFRQAIKDPDEYTWWPSGEMGKGDGWRTDYQVVSSALQGRIEHGAIYKTQTFSSHLPVIIDYDLELT